MRGPVPAPGGTPARKAAPIEHLGRGRTWQPPSPPIFPSQLTGGERAGRIGNPTGVAGQALAHCSPEGKSGVCKRLVHKFDPLEDRAT